MGKLGQTQVTILPKSNEGISEFIGVTNREVDENYGSREDPTLSGDSGAHCMTYGQLTDWRISSSCRLLSVSPQQLFSTSETWIGL